MYVKLDEMKIKSVNRLKKAKTELSYAPEWYSQNTGHLSYAEFQTTHKFSRFHRFRRIDSPNRLK